MTKHEAFRQIEQEKTLMALGISSADADALRRISITLHRWYEQECGDEHGCICRDDTTDKPYWLHARSGERLPIADREAGAHRRLYRIMDKYPTLKPYLQTDPRGAALYLLRPGDVPAHESPSAYYNRGICVY